MESLNCYYTSIHLKIFILFRILMVIINPEFGSRYPVITETRVMIRIEMILFMILALMKTRLLVGSSLIKLKLCTRSYILG